MNEKYIPDEAVNFATELAALAKKYKLSRFSGEFMHGHRSDLEKIEGLYYNKFRFYWECGRHDVDMDKINLTAEVQSSLQIGGKKGPYYD